MRTKIALRNLYISQAIIIIFLIFAYFTWFPYSFASLGGFTKTAWMLILVDLVLGPLLVFIVFKEGKKYLKFDINTLLAIQIGAFLFGAYSLYLKHPAYAVFNGNGFTLTNVSHLYPQPPWQEQLRTNFFSSPRLVLAKFPEKSSENNSLLFSIVFNGEPDIDERVKYYEPFEKNIDTIFSRSIKAEKLLSNDEGKERIDAFIDQHGGVLNDYTFFPLSGNNKKEMIWVFNRDSAQPVGIIDSNPRQITER